MPARDSVSRRNRWSLLIDDLKPEDSGNYTCFVVNGYGNTSATFVLEVFGKLTEWRASVALFEKNTPRARLRFSISTARASVRARR